MHKISDIAERLRRLYGDEEAAKLMDMSRNTMYKRIKNNDWRKKEITHIRSIKI